MLKTRFYPCYRYHPHSGALAIAKVLYRACAISNPEQELSFSLVLAPAPRPLGLLVTAWPGYFSLAMLVTALQLGQLILACPCFAVWLLSSALASYREMVVQGLSS